MTKYDKYVKNWTKETSELDIDAIVNDWDENWFMIQWSDYHFRIFKIKNLEKALFDFRIPVTTTVGNILINKLKLENRGVMKDIGGSWKKYADTDESKWGKLVLTKGKFSRRELNNALGIKTSNITSETLKKLNDEH